MARYAQPGAGEWVQPVRRGYKLACCDCGLVHVLDFKLVKYGGGKHKIRFRGWRNDRSTALTRRQNDYRCKPKRRR
ncbi:MAG TPA: hypothetical protein VFI87_12040 [Hyphomicrobiaceae bacterium]|nr:hypothetical protein [Hyphomicrobiaceae bacterium]